MARMRSPNYPAVGLSQCIQSLRNFWNKEKRTSVTSEVAAKAIGYKGLNGPARTVLSAMKKYGLLEENKDTFRLSDRGLRIVASQDGTNEQLEAIREAALSPEIFREILSTHSDASDEALKSHLLIKKKFTDEGAKAFIRSFRDTIEIAKLMDSSYNIPQQPVEEGFDMANPYENEPAYGTVKRPITAPLRTTRVLSFLLSKDVTAEVRLTGENIKPSHLQGLRQHIELTQKLWEADNDPVGPT